MGLKWFRARMSLDEPVTATGVPGFYRTRSQFDAEVWPPPVPIIKKPRAVAVPVAPPQVPVQNPLAVPKNVQQNSSDNPNNNESSDEEDETHVPRERVIPRASVDLLRETNLGKKKKKKKGMAPKPQGSMNKDRFI